MLKKTIRFTDYNGTERVEDFYFNLSKADLMEMELSTEGGMQERLKRVVDTQNSKEILEIFKSIVRKAYGEKSLDGRTFKKSPELTDAFEQTEAYSELFMELLTDADASAAFMNGIIPQGIALEPDAIEDIKKEYTGAKIPAPARPPIPKVPEGFKRPNSI